MAALVDRPLTFLTGFKNRFGALARWAISFVGRGRYERALTGQWAAGGRRSPGSSRRQIGRRLIESMATNTQRSA